MIIIPKWRAIFFAPGAKVVLNANIIDLLASAKSTSVSVISPGDAYNTLILTFSCSICLIVLTIASTEPWISVLITKLITPWILETSKEYLSDVELTFKLLFVFFLSSSEAFAFLSSLKASKRSPIFGTSGNPQTKTGDEAIDFVMATLFELIIPLTFAICSLVTIISPISNVPSCTSNVATHPLVLSMLPSKTVPWALPVFEERKSNISLSITIISKSSLILVPCLALIGIIGVSPPQSSGITLWVVNSCLIFSMFASSLSILLIATINGTCHSLIHFIVSIVWGFTPSSAATTSIAISVTCAPLYLIEEKASWPGVSKNTSFFFSSL